MNSQLGEYEGNGLVHFPHMRVSRMQCFHTKMCPRVCNTGEHAGENRQTITGDESGSIFDIKSSWDLRDPAPK